MKNKWINRLPWVAVIALAGLILLVWLGPSRSAMIAPDPAAAAQAEKDLKSILAIQPQTLDNPAFLDVIQRTLDEGKAATLWVFSPEGEIIMAVGSTANATKATNPDELPIQALLESLPADSLTEDQRSLLVYTAWMMAEGEHNDVYDHKSAYIANSNGELLGIIGMAYEVSPQISQASLAWKLSLLGGIALLGIYWLSLPLWVYLDARERGEKAVTWMSFVLLGNLVALIAYLLTRNPGKEKA
ncbi:MAG: hypothetical protein CVU39_22225 [Chloroflexi bacterium HGW-Chloroflexi-10]|nr:MAG: hypothetical protein CVU39_22225 [Chloroflexi bacterium HGW-Chloroflexi-10]